MSLAVSASPAALSTTVTNSARAATAMWRPAALTVTAGGQRLPATALGNTTITYATASTTGSCATAPARWTVDPALAILPPAGGTPLETLTPNASANLCLNIQPGAELLTRYPGQTLTLTTGIDAQAPAPGVWTAPRVSWVTTFRVPAPTAPALGSCAVTAPNQKAVEISWTWAGVGTPQGWDILQWNGTIWAPIAKDVGKTGNHPEVPADKHLPGDRRSTTIRPGKNDAEDVKVRLHLVGGAFIDSSQVFTFAAVNQNNEKVACGDLAQGATATTETSAGRVPAPMDTAADAPVTAPSPAPEDATGSAPLAVEPQTRAATASPATTGAAPNTDTTTAPAAEGK
ncbi:hypothetical protein FE374_02910 [Georgenia yuyongxinii]|uniref:Uncharacterized protein n=1 Tax=Georgenia yuyongxinii TaxID=2589797 RepID=A0A5B8BZS6_9MICO|nr:hypothetical protein [Georgenia yuyongxinii]QDC23718.1 hypothetical protein FE374_02910 [Georgenia yuyongxinii]